MAARVAVVLMGLLVVAPAIAGCLGGEDEGDDAGSSADVHVPSTSELATAHPFSLFLCKDGYYLENDALEVVDRCNHRVTKPLVDPGLLNVVDQHGPGNEVSIAVSPTNPLNVAGGAKDYTVSYVSDVAQCGEYTVWMGTFASFDGGITWANDLMPGFPGDTRSSSLTGNWCNTDPVLVFDDDGTLWYSGLNYDGARGDMATATNPQTGHDLYSGSQLYFARSEDGGATYPEISFGAFGDDNVIFNDKQWFAAQPGGDHMIATWSQFTPAGNVFAYVESLDGGLNWLPQRILRPGTSSSLAGFAESPLPIGVGLPALGQFSMPQYLPGSQMADLAVIWWDGFSVLYAEGIVTPGGTEFGPVQSSFPVSSIKSGPDRDGTGPSEFRSSTYPVLAVDMGGACEGRRYVVWADQPGEVDSDVQVLMATSDDGLSWSEPITVNDVEAGDQIFPWIDVDAEGGVHVAWYDRRNDPDNRLLDIYYAYSDDCGETFHPNVRVTETSFDGDLGHHQSGVPFIGDYMGVDATPISAHILWADTRHTGEAGREAGSDVYSATVLKDAGARASFDRAFAG